MPPKNWMIAAPGAVALATPLPKTEIAMSRPRPGPGLASSRNSTDLPVSAASVRPSGVSTPWLMALLRKNTLAGSMTTEVSGSRLLSTSVSTPLPRTSMTLLTIGAMTQKPTIAITNATMPAENMLTSISKPARTLPSQIASSFFMTQAASGPMIMAPMNMCT